MSGGGEGAAAEGRSIGREGPTVATAGRLLGGIGGILSFRAALALIVVLAAALQLADLDRKSLWDDEVRTVAVAGQPSLSALYDEYVQSERHPPLHYIVLHGWIRLAGDGDLAVRVPSALFSIGSVLLLGWLGLRILGRRAGLVAAYLLAVSPFLLLFGRMARYYSMALFLTLLSTVLLVEALSRPQGHRLARLAWLLYPPAAVAMLLTSYPNAAVFLAQLISGAIVVVAASRARAAGATSLWRRWVGAQLAVAAAFAAWIAIDFDRLLHLGTPARAAAVGGWRELALEAGYPLYAWTLGETIFPWHPAAAVALAVLSFIVPLGVGALVRNGVLGWVPLIAFATGMTLMLATYELFSRDLPFETLASRGIGVLPFLVLVVAAGVGRAPRRLAALAVVALTLASAVSAWNYFQGRAFHNAIYTVPTREVVAMIAAEARPGDVLLADPDLSVDHYRRAHTGIPAFYFTSEGDRARAALASGRHDRVWLVTAGRDSTRQWTEAWGGDALEALIERDFRLLTTWRLVPQDPVYARLKERLQGFESYDHKLIVRLFAARES